MFFVLLSYKIVKEKNYFGEFSFFLLKKIFESLKI